MLQHHRSEGGQQTGGWDPPASCPGVCEERENENCYGPIKMYSSLISHLLIEEGSEKVNSLLRVEA